MYKNIDKIQVSSSTKNGRPICQFTLEGEFIKEYRTMSEASKELNIAMSSMWRAANKNNNQKSAGGYQWRYADECEKLEE